MQQRCGIQGLLSHWFLNRCLSFRFTSWFDMQHCVMSLLTVKTSKRALAIVEKMVVGQTVGTVIILLDELAAFLSGEFSKLGAELQGVVVTA